MVHHLDDDVDDELLLKARLMGGLPFVRTRYGVAGEASGQEGEARPRVTLGTVR